MLEKPPYEIGLGTFAEIERMFFPLKIADSPIQTYIVPIKPKWARDLFDTGLANQGLFPAPEDLALRREQVYYRSRLNNANIAAPARILWYVSKDNKVPTGTMAVKACSALIEVNVDGPRELFAKYKRLGIYQWRDVLETAKGDISNDIMALRFGSTELFEVPIPYDDLDALCKRHDFGKRLFSISRIPHSAFVEIYSKGMNRRHDK